MNRSRALPASAASSLRIIRDIHQATSLPPEWGASDLHVHTYFSHDVLPVPSNDPEHLYSTAMQRGLQYVSFTDHDTMDAYDRVGWTRDGLIPGVEIKVLDKKHVGHTVHVCVYGLNRCQYAAVRPLAGDDARLGLFLEYLRSENLPHVYCHPFWFERGESPSIASVFDIAPLFPVIEYNRGRTAPLNRLAVSLAQVHGKGVISSSDSHTRRTLGTTRTYAPGAAFEEHFENVAAGRSCLLVRDMTTHGMVDEVNEWIRQLFLPSRVGARLDVPLELNSRRMVGPLNWLARDGFIRNNLFWRGIEQALYALSRAAFLQAMYVRGQRNLAQRIVERLPMLAGEAEGA